jgi:hypothetical protein
LLGGRYKQAGLQRGDRAELLRAYAIYRATYERTRDPYPGINVAACALYLGGAERLAESLRIAAEIEASVRALMSRLPDDVDHWRIASLAEALLLQKRLEDAKTAYESAVAAAPRRPHDIAVMRRQARLNLRYLGQSPSALDDALPVPGVAAFTGHMTDAPGRRPPRFPEARVPSVRERIRGILHSRNVRFGFCSGARGGDLIFLEELLQRGGTAKLVLPFPAEAFKKTSVGGAWDRSFDRLAAAKGVELMILHERVPPESEQSEAFADCNREIARLTIEQARLLDQRPLLISVWNGDVETNTGGTGDFVRSWSDESERDVETVAPFERD